MKKQINRKSDISSSLPKVKGWRLSLKSKRKKFFMLHNFFIFIKNKIKQNKVGGDVLYLNKRGLEGQRGRNSSRG